MDHRLHAGVRSFLRIRTRTSHECSGKGIENGRQHDSYSQPFSPPSTQHLTPCAMPCGRVSQVNTFKFSPFESTRQARNNGGVSNIQQRKDALQRQNNKMAQTRAKRADELREIVSIMERIGKSVSSSAKTQVDEKDRKTLMSLGNSLDEIRGMLTGNGRKDRGRADTQPNHRNAAGGSDNSYGDQICRYWSAGNCKKGSACKFKHPDDNGGEQAQGGVKPTCATEGCDKKCGKQKNGEFYKHCYDCGKKAGAEQQKDAGFVAAPETDIREQEMDSIFDEWAALGIPKPVPQVNERIMFHAMECKMKPDTCSSTSALWGETQACIANMDVDAAQITIAHNTVRRMMGTNVFSENEEQIYLHWNSENSFKVNMSLFVSDMLDKDMEFSESVYEECERAWSAFTREIVMENMKVQIEEIVPDGQYMFRALSKETDIDLDEIKAMARDWILKNSKNMMYSHVNQTVEGWIADEMQIFGVARPS